MSQPFIITLDGPGGVGKSTIAKKLAKAMDIPMLDTGSMYRTLGIKLGAEIMDLDDDDVEKKASQFSFSLDGKGASSKLLCNGEFVDNLPIRTEKASRLSSLIAKHPIVRKVLQEHQRKIGEQFSIIAEGRDMGTKVFPHAQCKVFLDASSEERAKRRYKELVDKGENPNYQELFESLQARDKQDRTRAIDPLKAADDAYLFDTTTFNFDEVYQHLYQYIENAMQTNNEKNEELGFTHLDKHGNACMVDVGAKATTKRVAIVACNVFVNENTMALLKENALPKGDVLTTAKVAGILAAKQTWALIPMCHPLAISYADIRFNIVDNPPCIEIEAETHTLDRTGVEMEAIIAAQVTAATIYDMCKAVQKDICISDCRLIHKSGGKSEYNYKA